MLLKIFLFRAAQLARLCGHNCAVSSCGAGLGRCWGSHEGGLCGSLLAIDVIGQFVDCWKWRLVCVLGSCGLDWQRVWTMTACAGGYWTLAGSSRFSSTHPPSCSQTQTRAGVRCCSDVQPSKTRMPSLSCEQLGAHVWDYRNPVDCLHSC